MARLGCCCQHNRCCSGGEFDGYLAAVADYVAETGRRPLADHASFRTLQAKFDTYDASIPVF